jgi:hypothetical protein
VERIVGTTGTGLAFFERDLPIGAARVGAWRPIPLPHVHPGDRLTEGWVANDDAWLLVWPEDLTKEPPRLMRTRPVQRVWVYATETPKE